MMQRLYFFNFAIIMSHDNLIEALALAVLANLPRIVHIVSTTADNWLQEMMHNVILLICLNYDKIIIAECWHRSSPHDVTSR